ncbi:MAG: SGNH/GDSL hydrolase family protein [Myxococcales bacterium]|nr:MAG: SGNH/GDSL hydrolase family protein [Myxococcales bacterium]
MCSGYPYQSTGLFPPSESEPLPSPAGRTSRPGQCVLTALGDAAYLAAWLLSFGAIVEGTLHSFVSKALVIAVLCWIAWASLRYARGRFKGAELGRTRRILAPLTLAAALAVMHLLPFGYTDFSSHYFHHPESDAWTWAPRAVLTECAPARGCFDHQMDECGFRGEPDRPLRPPANTVALIGDSFVFGSGVRDGATLADALERDFASFSDGPVRFHNAGIPGSALASFRGLVRQAEFCHPSGLYAILVKRDDLELLDVRDRLDLMRENALYRLFVVSGFEVGYDALRQALRAPEGSYGDEASLTRALDEIDMAAGPGRILFLLNVTEPHAAIFSRWVERRPRHGMTVLKFENENSRPESIPDDGHWTEGGNRTVARAIRRQVEWMLTRPDGPGWSDLNDFPLAGVGDSPDRSIVRDVSKNLVQVVVPGQEDAYVLNVLWCDQQPYYARRGDVCFALNPPKHPLSQSEEHRLREIIDALPAESRKSEE